MICVDDFKKYSALILKPIRIIPTYKKEKPVQIRSMEIYKLSKFKNLIYIPALPPYLIFFSFAEALPMIFQSRFSLFKKCGAIFTMIFAIYSTPLLAQEVDKDVIATAGASYEVSSDILMTWTIGETAIETYDNGSLMLAQGFHQPQILITPLLESANTTSADISIFPNPTADFLKINLRNSSDFKNLQNVKVELLDLHGRSVHVAELSGEHSIDLQSVTNGTYLLRLTDADNKQVGSYKIEKIK